MAKTTRVAPPAPAVLAAEPEELLARLERFEALESLKAAVQLQLTFLSEARDKQTDVRQVRGAVLAKRPNLSRIQAQYPTVGGTAFDMASDGEEFRVYLAWRSRLFEGDAKMNVRSTKRAENIRPQHVLEALLIEPMADDEWAAVENRVEGRGNYYAVTLHRRVEPSLLRITRRVWFSRADLGISRVEIFDPDGKVATEALYFNWREVEGVPYPGSIVMNRPLDGYTLSIDILKPDINEPIAEDAFILETPAGVKVERITDDQTQAETRDGAGTVSQ